MGEIGRKKIKTKRRRDRAVLAIDLSSIRLFGQALIYGTTGEECTLKSVGCPLFLFASSCVLPLMPTIFSPLYKVMFAYVNAHELAKVFINFQIFLKNRQTCLQMLASPAVRKHI
ncbi:uncharacterized protein LOC126605327 isoform X1 [Malus sylvestris]|uniref:uncharacterized protein LOC126605327 isoform X1 n=1 Tax=Malus sylvestris TaxID=3752 RepID=UPI0021ABA38D|nr:uncharacterized protein LOC126605327 isoform X1 [Malus sylvestris]